MNQNKNFLTKNKTIMFLVISIFLTTIFLTVNIKATSEPAPDWYEAFSNSGDEQFKHSHSTSDERSKIASVARMDGIANKFAGVAVGIALAIATITIAYSGYEYMTAGGTPDKMYAAKMRVIYTMVGLSIVMLASTLIDLFSLVVGF